MENIINIDAENMDPTNDDLASSADDLPESGETDNADGAGSGGARPMKVMRFLRGILLATMGVGLMLAVAFGVLHGWGVQGDISMPIIGLCMIIGLMLLGGGFGLMATASGTFDDDEFDRLMAGENRRFDEHIESSTPNVVISPLRTVTTDDNRRTGRKVENLQST